MPSPRIITSSYGSQYSILPYSTTLDAFIHFSLCLLGPVRTKVLFFSSSFQVVVLSTSSDLSMKSYTGLLYLIFIIIIAVIYLW